MSRPLVSVLISVFGQMAHTQRCLRCLKSTLHGKIDHEILIVDDCSEDETVEFLKTLDPEIRTYFNSQNQGFAKNNNFMAREARGRFLCLLNNDVFVRGDWLAPMIEALENSTDAGIVGNVQKLFQTARYDHMGVVFSPQGNPRHYGQGYFHRPFKGEIREWSAVTAACCLIPRDYFIEIGGFDEHFVNGCEDVDLCLRISQNGKRCLVAHDSVVEHVKGASEGRKRFNDENFQFLFERWGDSIRRQNAVADQYKHAVTYFYRGISKPFSTNFWKWIQAFLIMLRIRKLRRV